MSNWITITADDLNDYQAGKLVNAARTKALAAGQADPFLKVMPDVISQMRVDVEACAVNSLSLTANSIPPSLRGPAILLIIEAMQSRLPGLDLSDDIKTLIKDAKDRMKRVAKCDIPIEIPTDPATTELVQRGGDVEAVGDRPFKATRETMASL